jgi:predicted nucleic acid-binding protein
MMVLDTNVISALMLPHMNEKVVAWLDRQTTDIWTTSVSILETRSGILMLPTGKRRQAMTDAFEELIGSTLRTRILPFDLASAEAAAFISANRIAIGINKETLDTQIAGIVVARGATLATRNVKDFEDLDIPLINPWQP